MGLYALRVDGEALHLLLEYTAGGKGRKGRHGQRLVPMDARLEAATPNSWCTLEPYGQAISHEDVAHVDLALAEQLLNARIEDVTGRRDDITLSTADPDTPHRLAYLLNRWATRDRIPAGLCTLAGHRGSRILTRIRVLRLPDGGVYPIERVIAAGDEAVVWGVRTAKDACIDAVHVTAVDADRDHLWQVAADVHELLSATLLSSAYGEIARVEWSQHGSAWLPLGSVIIRVQSRPAPWRKRPRPLPR